MTQNKVHDINSQSNMNEGGDGVPDEEFVPLQALN